jgi:hypothetical protein
VEGEGVSGTWRFLAHAFGDYVVQSNWQAQSKTQRQPAWAAGVGVGVRTAALHAATYTACFLPLTRDPRRLLVVGGTHFVIDHWRLARYVVWAKNQAAPRAWRYPLSAAGPFGYGPEVPDWLAGWLLFVADNAIHLAINEAALTYKESER